MTPTCILTDIKGLGRLKTGWIALNRPQQLNALNDTLMDELGAALLAFDADPQIGCIVLTGNEKAFAAGADVPAMASLAHAQAFREDFITRNWETIRRVRKPVIAAVAGFALGGGCELVMMCDLVLAADTARFGQPEIKLGVIPGAGGTQRLPRAVGKAKAMDLLLTGRMMGAEEAERAGLVSRIVPAAVLQAEALAVAEQINSLGTTAAMMIKECVNEAFESGLSTGVRLERRMFQSIFGSADQREGMAAFLAKRAPEFNRD